MRWRVLRPRRGRADGHRRRRVQPRLEPLEDRLVLATLPPGFTEVLVVDGLTRPTAMQFTPDGRILVAEQGGTLRVVEDGQLLDQPFLSLDVKTDGERGLIGVTVDPHFEHNGFVYVHYTTPQEPVRNRVSRFTAQGNVARPGSERVILELDPIGHANQHNGGALHFGLDGKLYVAVGENAFAPNAASLDNRFGKLLRINPDGSIPTDNPFYHSAQGPNRAIWALGLRNPYTFAIQPGTGLMYINDVGASAWEEINQGRRGADYGWPETEGYTNIARYQSPIYAYAHGTDDQTGCAITGGVFYNPQTLQFPAEYEGQYFFTDYCNQWIRQLNPKTHEVSAFATDLPVTFTVDLDVGPDGALYYLARGRGHTTGVIYQIRYTANEAPSIVHHPRSTSVSAGHPATFVVHAAGAPPLHYQWQRDGRDIEGANGPSYTIETASLDDHGATFRVLVRNERGILISQSAALSVTTRQPPRATITLPEENTLYHAGQRFTFEGVGFDADDKTLPASAFTWWVDFHHDDHTHPFIQPLSGVRSRAFTIPASGEKDTNVWYRIYLTVTDATGLTHTTHRDIHPQISQLRLVTNPPGLQIRLDGRPVTTPYVVNSVVGMPRQIQPVSPQTLDGTTFVFDAWTDGHPMLAQDFVTGETTRTFRAYYRERDTRTDLAVYRPPLAGWFTLKEPTAYRPRTIGEARNYGIPISAIPVPADYDGDGVMDLAIFSPEIATWFMMRSTDKPWQRQFGAPNLDIPVPGDYDGDGRTDLAVFRPTTATWYVFPTATLPWSFQFGAAHLDIPIPGDYNGDGFTDLAVFRPTTAEWFLRFANGGSRVVQFGAAHLDRPIPADYDGDGAWDLAVYRPTTAEWFLQYSGGGSRAVQFGAAGMDIPVPADYDGDRKADLAVFRPTTAEWFLQQSLLGPRVKQFGAARMDVPLNPPLIYRYRGSLPMPSGTPRVLYELGASQSVSGSSTARSLSESAGTRSVAGTVPHPIPAASPPPLQDTEDLLHRPRRRTGLPSLTS